MSGAFGLGDFGSSSYGSTTDHFVVVGAAALNAFLFDIEFNTSVDLTDPATTAPSSYTVSPPVGITSVTIVAPNKVRLLASSALSNILYTVVVTSLRSADGVLINPAQNSATFTGPSATGTPFRAVGLSSTRIHVLFDDEPRLQNAALTDPTSYGVTAVDGSPIAVSGVVVEAAASSLVLLLATPMRSTVSYTVDIDSAVVSLSGLPSNPPQTVFRWVSKAPVGTFRVGEFSGEVSGGGLLGNPAGLVFFSPALSAPAANSTIQVDDVSTCSRAYDSYVFPKTVDPPPLYTYDPSKPTTVIGPGLGTTVLWAAFPKLVETRLDLTLSPADTVPQAVDGPAVATFREPFDHTRISLLNNPAWRLFDNSSPTTPPLFITADNLTPIPPGPTVTVTLQP